MKIRDLSKYDSETPWLEYINRILSKDIVQVKFWQLSPVYACDLRVPFVGVFLLSTSCWLDTLNGATTLNIMTFNIMTVLLPSVIMLSVIIK